MLLYKDKIYKQLKNEKMRDLTLKGKLKREDCDDENVFKFLKLTLNQKNKKCNVSKQSNIING